ncbi:lysophospholipid acyltransferase family protein [Thiohalorhabdus sp.]|uniref:lysophospholipid acyltransferase family protein n=1 Tax=Thiohalorhabdus sp. TaxID=3094134 RepID=UPI002FC2BCBF
MASILPDHAGDWPLWARVVHGLIGAYCRTVFRMRSDPSTLPENGPAILVANHNAGPDPLFLIATNRRLISYLIATEYYRLNWLNWLLSRVGCVPVDRRQVTAATLRGALKRLEDGRVVGIFPEGGIHTPEKRPKPKPGAALLALETGAPVIPARVAGVRQLPGSDLWTFLRPRRARLRYGSPVPLEDLYQRYATNSEGDSRKLVEEAAHRIVEAIYALPE